MVALLRCIVGADKHPQIEVKSYFVDHIPQYEARVFTYLLKLAQHLELDRVNVCPQCHEFYFQTRRDQKYCSTRCRQTAFDQSPERRKEIRQNAREYYKIHKIHKKKNRKNRRTLR